MSVRELILASAGSGKTFRISSRIIGLLARDEAPASIFASTFTRKAAGEILDRVLIRMAVASSGDDEAAELSRHVASGGPDPLPTDAAFWRGVLQRSVRELHRLDVSTLDAFFVRALNSFAHDVGLPPGWGIADEPTADRLRAEALDEVLGRDHGLPVELLRALHAGAVRRSVHGALATEVDQILEVHQALAPDRPGWSALRQVAEPVPADMQERCTRIATAIRAVDLPKTKKGTEDSRWRKAADKAADCVATRSWDDYLSPGLYAKLTDGTDEESAAYYDIAFPDDLPPLLEEAAGLARLDILEDLAGRAEAMGRLAESYDEAFGRRLLETGELRFDDVTRLLTGDSPLGGRGDLFYRLDGSTRHLLLDEFQDTSILQWRALVPLVDRLTADSGPDRTVAVVADPKQSIYGWRGAAPVVVDALAERYQLPTERLTLSWRSSPVVLEAVNRVFGRIHETPTMADDAVDARVAEEWLTAFGEHEAAHADRPGYVELIAGPPMDGRANQQPALSRFAAERVRQMMEASPGRSVGVLTRTNGTVARMIYELGRLGVPASEEGGTRLTDSASVVSVLALLRLADHPGNGLARYHVATTPVGTAVGLTDWADGHAANRVAHRWRRDLLEDGYGPTLAALADVLGQACDPRERRRLGQLVELGYRYDASGAGMLRVDDFVSLAIAQKAESPGQDRVRVMTVHRSKGLEFDIVVLPDLHPTMFGRGGDTAPLTYRPEPGGPVTHAYPPVKSAYAAVLTDVRELQEARNQSRAGTVRDALGGLYVAMTRARHALHMVIPADGDRGPGTTRSPARILRETLSDLPEGEAVTEGMTLHESGDAEWSAKAEPSTVRAAASETEIPDHIPLRAARRTRVLDRKTPSSEEGGDTVDLSLLLGMRGTGGRLRGTLVHEWLETLDWIEDGMADEAELLRIAAAVAPKMPPDEVERVQDWLQEQLQAPAVREVLSRESWPEGTEIEKELPFIVREGDALVEGFVDRLMLTRDSEGRVIRAEVLDYKTDAVDATDPEALERRVDYYRPQIEAYRRAVAEVYALDLEDVGGRLVMLGAGVVG